MESKETAKKGWSKVVVMVAAVIAVVMIWGVQATESGTRQTGGRQCAMIRDCSPEAVERGECEIFRTPPEIQEQPITV